MKYLKKNYFQLKNTFYLTPLLSQKRYFIKLVEYFRIGKIRANIKI